MTDQPDHALSFGSVADAYDRGRPGYPVEAAAWLAGEEPAVVLEVGAGTGKLTEALLAAGHEVHATDPDDAMLARLRARLPDVPTAVAPAERLPAADATYDVVVAGQAFHWFDQPRALTEFARVLRPGGRIALVWNERNERIPWVRRLGAILGGREGGVDPTAALLASGWFGFVESRSFKHWLHIDRTSVQDLTTSRSHIAVLDEEARRAKVAEVLAFYDDYGRGMDGMELPYQATCFRATVTARPEPTEQTEETEKADDEAPASTGSTPAPTGEDDEASDASGATTPETTGASGSERRPDSGDDVLLIDFR